MFTEDWGNRNRIEFLPGFGEVRTRESWAKAIFEAAKNEAGFQEAKRASPFVSKVVIAVSYGRGTKLYGDISSFADANGGIDVASSVVKSAIRTKGWRIHDADDYLLVFDGMSVFGKQHSPAPEIFWIGSKKGSKGPESA